LPLRNAGYLNMFDVLASLRVLYQNLGDVRCA
jgi:hypothetical protein